MRRRPAYHLLTRPSPRVEKFLGRLEAEIMEILWQRGRGTVRDVADTLAARRPIAYTTVMTVMSRLVDKGLLARQGDRRQFVYTPALDRDEFLRRLSARIVDDLVADFGDMAIAQFVAAIERVDPERLAALRALAHGNRPADAPPAAGSEPAAPARAHAAPPRPASEGRDAGGAQGTAGAAGPRDGGGQRTTTAAGEGTG